MTHPFRITAGKVVVDCYQVDAATRKSIEINCKGGYERLPLACGHLCYAPFVKHNPADELHIEVDHVPSHGLVTDSELHPAHASRGILHDCKCFGENLVQSPPEDLVILYLREFGFPSGGFVP